jgi:hypothetical protein
MDAHGARERRIAAVADPGLGLVAQARDAGGQDHEQEPEQSGIERGDGKGQGGFHRTNVPPLRIRKPPAV